MSAAMACSIPNRSIEPGRYNFPQGAIYRLKLTNIPGQPGVELYPTLELALATPRTEAFLAHNFIPFELTAEDFEQVLSGNFVTKVIYLPDAEHQEAVLAGAETLVSTRLEPGKDPIVEAEKRGSIMAIIRIGNKDLQAPAPRRPAASMQTGFHGASRHGTRRRAVRRWRLRCRLSERRHTACGGMPPGFVAGVTSPLYGMPMCGTPIGLPARRTFRWECRPACKNTSHREPHAHVDPRYGQEVQDRREAEAGLVVSESGASCAHRRVDADAAGRISPAAVPTTINGRRAAPTTAAMEAARRGAVQPGPQSAREMSRSRFKPRDNHPWAWSLAETYSTTLISKLTTMVHMHRGSI